MRTIYPFGWIDRDLKNLGFLKEMSPSATKLYILYILAGGPKGRSDYGIKALIDATGLSNVTIYKARRELEQRGFITAQKEMVPGRKNKKPKIWVELQDLPVDRLELKQRRTQAHKQIVTKKVRKRRSEFTEEEKMLCDRLYQPDWLKAGVQKLRKERKSHV